MNDDDLRRWYAARSAPPDGEHPSADAVIALVSRIGLESDRLATLDHVMQCDACRGDFELLRAIHGASRIDRARTLPRWLPVAALVMLTVGASLWWRREHEPDVTRGAPVGVLSLALPADTVVRSGAPLLFAWHPLRQAARYRFELLGADGRLVFAAEGSDTAVAVPDPIAVPPGRYRWLVVGTPFGAAAETAMGSLVVR